MHSSVAKKSQKRGSTSLAFGLNNRKGSKKSTIKNVFGDDDESSDSSDDINENKSKSRREVVNEQISKEQAVRRRRAQAALASVKDNSAYDYDGAYDSFQTTNTKLMNDGGNEKETGRKSKYIGDLMKAAKIRERERDAIFERKNALEQAEEDAQGDYLGKEKFVTNSYKRKLQERKLWEAEQEERNREEIANDVTKKSAGTAFAGFYGNLTRSTMMEQTCDDEENTVIDGGNASRSSEVGNGRSDAIDDDNFDPRQDFLGGFERSSASGGNVDVDIKDQPHGQDDSTENTKDKDSNMNASSPKQSLRSIRERKVAEARERYLKRRKALILDQ